MSPGLSCPSPGPLWVEGLDAPCARRSTYAPHGGCSTSERGKHAPPLFRLDQWRSVRPRILPQSFRCALCPLRVNATPLEHFVDDAPRSRRLGSIRLGAEYAAALGKRTIMCSPR